MGILVGIMGATGIIWWDPSKRAQMTQYLKPSVNALAKSFRDGLLRVENIIDAKYPERDVYSHYDSSAAVERLVSKQERQAEFLQNAVYNLEGASTRSAEEIVSSIKELNSDLAAHMDVVADSVEALRSDFTYEMDVLIDSVRHASSILADISDAQRHPQRTAALELRGDAIECWRDGLLEEAVAKLEKSKGHYDIDPMPYKLLGGIYLLEPDFIDLGRAKANFEKAYRYSAPKSVPLAAETMYLLGLTCWAQRKPEEAIAATEKALQIMPDYAEAKYQLAEFKAMTGSGREAIGLLDQAIRANKGYFRKAMMDSSFDPIRAELNSYFGSLVKHHKGQAQASLDQAMGSFRYMERLHRLSSQTEALEKAHALLDRASKAQKDARDLVDTQMVLYLSGVASALIKATVAQQSKALDSEMAARQKKLHEKLAKLDEFKLPIDISDVGKHLLESEKAGARSDYEGEFSLLKKAEDAYLAHAKRIFSDMEALLKKIEQINRERIEMTSGRNAYSEPYLGYFAIFTDTSCFIDGDKNPARRIMVSDKDSPSWTHYICRGCYEKHFGADETRLEAFFKTTRAVMPWKGTHTPMELQDELEMSRLGVPIHVKNKSIFKGMSAGMLSYLVDRVLEPEFGLINSVKLSAKTWIA